MQPLPILLKVLPVVDAILWELFLKGLGCYYSFYGYF